MGVVSNDKSRNALKHLAKIVKQQMDVWFQEKQLDLRNRMIESICEFTRRMELTTRVSEDAETIVKETLSVPYVGLGMAEPDG
ncbi:hypothetical protein HDV00_004494 [Rhizophlyctis rosea]|nr:hypothetical protein HDV00_004494 [Rhizophlyctis rosea]